MQSDKHQFFGAGRKSAPPARQERSWGEWGILYTGTVPRFFGGALYRMVTDVVSGSSLRAALGTDSFKIPSSYFAPISSGRMLPPT